MSSLIVMCLINRFCLVFNLKKIWLYGKLKRAEAQSHPTGVRGLK